MYILFIGNISGVVIGNSIGIVIGNSIGIVIGNSSGVVIGNISGVVISNSSVVGLGRRSERLIGVVVWLSRLRISSNISIKISSRCWLRVI